VHVTVSIRKSFTKSVYIVPTTAALLVALSACAGGEARHLPGRYRLVQKQEFQALYGPDGRIQRLLQDRNHDGRAEAVIVYRPNGKPERGEIDTDDDGAVDRWELFDDEGALVRVDLDTNHDGRVDRTEYGPH
jgi:hypothetical protein